MEPLNGHPCPECGTPRLRDNSPACACADRAAKALLDNRTAQAAAAEDFDPLRIRPYVEITEGGGPSGQDTHAGAEEPASAAAPSEVGAGAADRPREGDAPRPAPADATPHPHPHPHPVDPDATTVLPATPAEAPPRQSAADHTTPRQSTTRDTATLPAVPPDTTASPPPPTPAPTTALPAPMTPGTSEPSVTDLRLFDGSGAEPGGREPAPGEDGEPRPGRRRRRVLLVAAAGACVAVVTAAGYASGLLSYESPSRDTALPDDIRASVPDAPSSSAAPTAPQASPSASPSASASPSPSPSGSGSPSASPSPSAPSASPSTARPTAPSASASATATAPGQRPPDDSARNQPVVLRLGDRGPEVTELQLRLRQLYLFNEDADGTFDGRLEDAVRTYQWSRGIQGDNLGVYDRETRAKLESETDEP
ncbi:peptidoglycan-binding domain-containing protein [Streptomyces sp. NPDC006624]|uniref:peptidoglycan-binding domain-containing protein n=1 Tax=Streptomyces sp. NPDC006624 TaxID=3154892 RepID=UPI0033A3E068